MLGGHLDTFFATTPRFTLKTELTDKISSAIACGRHIISYCCSLEVGPSWPQLPATWKEFGGRLWSTLAATASVVGQVMADEQLSVNADLLGPINAVNGSKTS